MTTTNNGLVVGPLASTLEVVVFLALTGMAWFNGAELLCTIFLTFKRWTGKYFYCLVIATLGVLVYQINVFMMIFATHLNAHGIIACIGIGWSMMVTGQSLVLWSRLHLVCRSTWKLRIILGMIIVNGVCMHGPQFVFSLVAVRNNAIDPTYKPFEVMEKISVAILTTQELIISIVYLVAATRILRVGETLQRKGNRRRIQLLVLANIAIICIDVCTITLEYLALWGVWCSFKGFGYSVKLKIEFAILNQLRDSVKGSVNVESYNLDESGKATGLSLRSRTEQAAGRSGRLGLKRQTFEQITDVGSIEKTTEINITHHKNADSPRLDQRVETLDEERGPRASASGSSSEVGFATRGV